MADTSSWRSSPTPSDRLAVARVIGPKGLRGRIRIEVLTDWPERLAVGSELFVESETAPRSICDIEAGGRVPAIHLEGIETRDAAERLTGRYLEAPATVLPEGSYYWHQLVGLRVIDPSGGSLGTLTEVFRAGGNEVYRVVGPSGEHLVPALRRIVERIDLAAGEMTVRLDPVDAGG